MNIVKFEGDDYWLKIEFSWYLWRRRGDKKQNIFNAFLKNWEKNGILFFKPVFDKINFFVLL